MKLSIVNGSPRGQKSNSKRITGWLTQNAISNTDVIVEEIFLSQHQKHDIYIKQLKDSDYILFIFPLYVDSMPAVVKTFFEKLELSKEFFKDKSTAFILHSGFPEAIHSRVLEKLVKYFSTKIMEMHCHGVVIMGGSESLQAAPDQVFSKKIVVYKRIYEAIINKADFTNDDLTHLSKPEKLSPILRLLVPMSSMFWNQQLKSNHAYKKRFDQPYL